MLIISPFWVCFFFVILINGFSFLLFQSSLIFSFSLDLFVPCLCLLPQVQFLLVRTRKLLLAIPMATVNLVSFNVRGLYAPGKRHNLYRELGRLRGDIVLLQETHLTHTTSLKLFSPQYPIWYYSLSDVHKAKRCSHWVSQGNLLYARFYGE